MMTTQDGNGWGVDWALVLIGFAITVVVLAVLGLGLKLVMENTTLTEDFNRSMIACVQAGKSPIECRVSLSGATVK